MNKSELAERIAGETNLARRDVDQVLKAFIETIQQEVKKGSKVSIPGFGG